MVALLLVGGDDLFRGTVHVVETDRDQPHRGQMDRVPVAGEAGSVGLHLFEQAEVAEPVGTEESAHRDSSPGVEAACFQGGRRSLRRARTGVGLQEIQKGGDALGCLRQGQSFNVRVLPHLGEFAVQALEQQAGQLLWSEVAGQLTKERID
ncbi:hypothetical protein AB0K02_11050 [Streptomyces sp. NPDC049597]|uniref:hypothetical protein n=1 Tax=Streptomyces sp. NPDC049597 TaxID=3155276 RepID=UPI00342D33A8